ncbi:hypothetical protein, partial [Okeania sp. SIO2G4]|uniref:hypothetical protein n=1 Tax=Okeania sp. SIO2G4 TaxID=2607793 RepID=UPI00257F407A
KLKQKLSGSYDIQIVIVSSKNISAREVRKLVGSLLLSFLSSVTTEIVSSRSQLDTISQSRDTQFVKRSNIIVPFDRV